MARPRKPTAVLELNGAFQRNPDRGRARENEPRPTDPVGMAPETLAEQAIPIWDEMVAVGFWLTRADRFLLEIAASLMWQFHSGAFEPKDHTVLINALTKLGFGPTERSKIKMPEQSAPSEFDEFK